MWWDLWELSQHVGSVRVRVEECSPGLSLDSELIEVWKSQGTSHYHIYLQPGPIPLPSACSTTMGGMRCHVPSKEQPLHVYARSHLLLPK